MTKNIRLFIWLSLALALYVNYTQWQMDYGPKPVAAATVTATNSAAASKPASIEDTVPQATQNASPTTAPNSSVAPVKTPINPQPELESTALVRVITDNLIVDIDLKGGTLVYAELPAYPLVKGKPEPVVLLNHGNPETNYSIQTGLVGPGNVPHPTNAAVFTSASMKYELAPGQQELRVPLTWTDGQGVTVTKTFVFHRSLFTIGLEYTVNNQSSTPWLLQSYARIVRSDPKLERSYLNVETYQFRGPAVWAPDKTGEKLHARKLNIEKPEDQITVDTADGWLAGMQHHFVAAVVPDRNKVYSYSMRLGNANRTYVLSAMGPLETVAPGTQRVVRENLFVGPKLQKQLTLLHPELDRVADYSWATPIARPLFLALKYVHSIVGNWGLAIMIVTFLLKLLFYPLSEKAGRSMARMRALAPRLKALQEQYKDDRAKLGQATMEIYKQEKVNPLAGCLPMFIQMPVFLAFYWVLLESVEMRQAPFMFWINDLSSRDPFFILPALNGLAMWFQQRLNPPPPDPVQAKVFQFMPVIFSVMFAFFPAGLVLYWVTNTSLSILQQWNINRKIAAEEKLRKR